jgi:hypothetical protein
LTSSRVALDAEHREHAMLTTEGACDHVVRGQAVRRDNQVRGHAPAGAHLAERVAVLPDYGGALTLLRTGSTAA